MDRFAAAAWGELGANIVKKWAEFNERYFGGSLRPIPLIITSTLPYGRLIGSCSYNPKTGSRLIKLNLPSCHNLLVADYNTLIHEMVHQYLQERGEDPHHASSGWCREIMRLN